MVSALPSHEAVPTYLEFFGMSRPPFARLSAPSEIFYSDQCSLLNSHLVSATEQVDSLIVVCGADGAGKTTLLNQYIAGLNEDTNFAAFDDSCTDGIIFYCSFLQQIGFGEVTGSLRELQKITREFLLHLGKSGEPVLFFLDNAHLVRPAVLEQLRWISETKLNGERVISMILSGNLNLPRIMDSPAMRSLDYRYLTNFHIRVYTEIETDDYVRHRLRLAGAADSVQLSDESRALIYRFTGGIPNHINKLCNAVLTEASVQGSRVISEQLIRAVADKRQIVPHAVPLKGKGRRKTDPNFSVNTSDDTTDGERITGRNPENSAAGKEAVQAYLHLEEEAGRLRTEIAKVQEKLGTVEGAKSQALLEVEKRERTISELQKQFTANELTLKKLTSDISDRDAQIQKFNSVLSDAKEKLKDGEIAAKTSAGKIKTVKQKLADQDDATAELQAQLQQSNEQIAELRKELSTSEAAREAAEKDAGVIAADLKKIQQDLAAENEQSGTLGVALEEKDAEIKSLTAAISKSQEDLSGRDDIEGKLAADILERDAENEKLSKALAKAEERLADLETAEKKTAADVDKKVAEITQLTTALAKSEEALAEREKTAKRLAADLDKWEASKSDEVISDLRSQLSTQSQEMEALVKSSAVYAAEVNSLKDSLADAKNELQDSSKSTKSVKAEAKKERRAAKRTSTELSKAQGRIDELVSKNDELQESVKAMNADIAAAEQLADSVDDMQNELEAARAHCATLEQRVEILRELEQSVSEKDARIAGLEVELAVTRTSSSATKSLNRPAQRANKSKARSGSAKSLDQSIVTVDVYHRGKHLQSVDTRSGPSRLMIGRATDSDLRLNSKFVSRHHAFLFCTPAKTYIEDLNSSNGIIVNDTKVNNYDLCATDKIIIGDFELKLKSA